MTSFYSFIFVSRCLMFYLIITKGERGSKMTLTPLISPGVEEDNIRFSVGIEVYSYS